MANPTMETLNVGDETFDIRDTSKVALPTDEDGNTVSGTAGQFALSDGNGGITWATIPNAEGVTFG